MHQILITSVLMNLLSTLSLPRTSLGKPYVLKLKLNCIWRKSMRETWQGNFRFYVQNINDFLEKATAYLIFATFIMILLIMIGGGYMSCVFEKNK
jgi:hypothetical protein